MASQEEVARLLTCPKNRAILTVLDDAAGPLSVTELAEQVLAGHDTSFDDSGDEATPEQLLVSLHHHRLPKLARANLIEYDSRENVVTLDDYGAVDPEWLDVDLFDGLLSRFGAGHTTGMDSVGVVEGREEVIESAQHLLDGAERELFFLFDDEEFVNESCFPFVDDAIDRGVDVSFGSRNRELQAIIREQFPGITIWDPQLDRLSTPSRNPRIGRLVVTDRERVLLSLCDDSGDTGTEFGMIGEGERNPLVVLVRELLGPRLDHLDYQSEDFRSDLPF